MGEADYWSEPVMPAAWVDAADKYAALHGLSSLSSVDELQAKLRSVARAWPGALREAELAGPDLCAQRRDHCRMGLGSPALTREAWRRRDAHAVVLWMDLHLLLADQLRFKREATGGDARALVDSLADAGARARWPSADTLATVAGDRVRPRQAYLWLASRAGLRLGELNELLLGRKGPWDMRPDDPSWSKIG